MNLLFLWIMDNKIILRFFNRHECHSTDHRPANKHPGAYVGGPDHGFLLQLYWLRLHRRLEPVLYVLGVLSAVESLPENSSTGHEGCQERRLPGTETTELPKRYVLALQFSETSMNITDRYHVLTSVFLWNIVTKKCKPNRNLFLKERLNAEIWARINKVSQCRSAELGSVLPYRSQWISLD